MKWIKENPVASVIILLIILAIIGYFTNWFGLGKKKNGNGATGKYIRWCTDGKGGYVDCSGWISGK